MFDNARRYNAEGSMVYEDADAMAAALESAAAELESAESKLEAQGASGGEEKTKKKKKKNNRVGKAGPSSEVDEGYAPLSSCRNRSFRRGEAVEAHWEAQTDPEHPGHFDATVKSFDAATQLYTLEYADGCIADDVEARRVRAQGSGDCESWDKRQWEAYFNWTQAACRAATAGMVAVRLGGRRLDKQTGPHRKAKRIRLVLR
jgi:hypothetical protein